MNDKATRLALKKRIARTWGAFFERHGNFSEIQRLAIPILLDGKNAMISAPTASGKTEAVIVPLIERHCLPNQSGLSILYLTPSRALVNDLLGRLSHPLETLKISLAAKTHDFNNFNPKQAASILITTPESLDSLLSSHAQVFANLRALVIDELHLFDATVRGDHLRVLLRRLQVIRDYAAKQEDAPDSRLQCVAVSASLPDAEQVVKRYFDDAELIQITGQRQLDVALLPMSLHSTAELLDYLQTFRAKAWRKALIFCNNRSELESYARIIKQESVFGDAVYVHYSNIAPQRRHEIEERFARDDYALCFATTTLELGIDVGNIDVVILLGPPSDSQSFVQRIGRGNRRKNRQQVACFYRSALEEIMFESFIHAPSEHISALGASFRLSVVIQQIFSLMKQSPSGGLRFANLRRLFEGLLSPEELALILGQLQELAYLKLGQANEWRAASRLNELFDMQWKQDSELSIYGNIQGMASRPIEIRDRYTNELVASVDSQWFAQDVLTLEGRSISVDWEDRHGIWVSRYHGENRAENPRFQSTRKYLSFDLAQSLAQQLAIESHEAMIVPSAGAWHYFHWLGDMYAYVLLNLLQGYLSIERGAIAGLCFHLATDPSIAHLPQWKEGQVRRFLEDKFRYIEPFLDLGAFHHLLPRSLRQQVVIEQFNIPLFVEKTASLTVSMPSETLSARLLGLLL